MYSLDYEQPAQSTLEPPCVLQKRFLQVKQRKSKALTEFEQPEWPHISEEEEVGAVTTAGDISLPPGSRI